ncbi:MAG: hypothetical protein ABI948_02325 [Thermoleophilia bacterium]
MDAAPAAIVVPAPSFKGLPHGWRQFNDAPDFLTRRGANAEAVATSWAVPAELPRLGRLAPA